jgi:hypothetical protein
VDRANQEMNPINPLLVTWPKQGLSVTRSRLGFYRNATYRALRRVHFCERQNGFFANLVLSADSDLTTHLLNASQPEVPHALPANTHLDHMAAGVADEPHATQ